MKKIYILILIFLSVYAFGADIIVPKVSTSKIDTNISTFKGVRIENFNNYANRGATDPQTSLYLKHDGENIYALFVCYEPNNDYPKSSKKTQNLLLEDAVSLVLGVTYDDNTDRYLSIGGYDGSYSKLANCDFYYSFNVNSSNQKERTFNETHLERPLFDSKVIKAGDKWLVAMKIPFSSFGLKNLNSEIFFNAYRSRPPQITAYNNEPFGYYRQRTFAKMKLSDTKEGEVINTFTGEPYKISTNAIYGFNFQYYPVANEIAGQVLFNDLDQEGYIKITCDKYKTVQVPLNKIGYTNARLKLGVEFPITAKCEVVLANGKVLKSETINVENKIDPPKYANSTVGKEDFIPAPWSKPIIENNSIKLYNKTITMGKFGLFSQVKTTMPYAFGGGEKDLLSNDMKIVLNKKGNSVPLSLVSQNLKEIDSNIFTETKLSIDNNETIDVKVKTAFDGFSLVKIRTNLDPTNVDGFYIDIPLKKENCQFVQRQHAQNVYSLDGNGYSGSCQYPLWVGGHQLGLFFENDVPLFLSPNGTFRYEVGYPFYDNPTGRNQIQIIEKENESILRLNFVNNTNQLKDQGHIFQFYLTPTPTKNYSLKKEGLYHNTSLWFEEWTDYQGIVQTDKKDELIERKNKAEENNNKLMLYYCPWLCEATEDYKLYSNDLTAYPYRPEYKRLYSISKGITCTQMCTRDLFGDMNLEGIQDMCDLGINSIYMDGSVRPWYCTNPTHNHCETNVSPTWTDNIMPIEATRDYLIRMRRIAQKAGKPFQMVAHNAGYINGSTLSLCDILYDGEHLCRYKQGYIIDKDTLAVAYCGIPWGLRGDLLPQRPQFTTEEFRTYALLHDSCVGDGPWHIKGGEELENKIYGDFQSDTTRYYPYWENQDIIKCSDNVLMSFYVNEDSAMLIFGNLKYTKESVICDFNNLFGKNIHVTNVISGEHVSSDGVLAFNIQPKQYKVYRIDKKLIEYETAPENKEIIQKEFSYNNIDCLKSNNDKAGVTEERIDNSLILHSEKNMFEAHGTLIEDLGNEFYGEFNIEKDDVLKIIVCDTEFVLSKSAVITNNNSGWINGLLRLNCPDSNNINVKIAFKDNYVDIFINDYAIALGVQVKAIKSRELSFGVWGGQNIKITPVIAESKYKDIAQNPHPIL